jgi:Cys-rich protein (TIGR01571 family)
MADHETAPTKASQGQPSDSAAPTTTTAGADACSNSVNGQIHAFYRETYPFKFKPEIPNAQPWHSGFWDCFSPVDVCLLTCFAPCVAFGKTHHRLRNGSVTDWHPINGACCGFYISAWCCLHHLVASLDRGELRTKYNLQGNPTEDFLRNCFCPWCALVQQEKEAIARAPGGPAASIDTPYQKKESMTYPS